MNLTGPLTIKATAHAENSFLAEMVRMMEAAEGGRARYRRLADRASALYSPVVHTIAVVSFLGWLSATGDWHLSIAIAISVLIITCPCALGLAVPIVQVVAARRLFERGIMVKDGSALERLAEVDTVLFDKTGVLTLGKPSLGNASEIAPSAIGIAATIAAGSRHPAALAIAAAGAGQSVLPLAFKDVRELPGLGMEAHAEGSIYRLGRPGWALGREPEGDESGTKDSISVLTKNSELLATFVLEDRVRPGAEQAVRHLASRGLSVEIVSGDRRPVVQMLAARLGIKQIAADLLPAEKIARIEQLARSGRKIMMVGDGLNDAPALVRCARLDGAGHSRRYRPQRRRLRLSERESFGGDRGARHLAEGWDADPAEFRACRRLQRDSGAHSHRGLRNPAFGGACHVAVFRAGGCKRVAAAEYRSIRFPGALLSVVFAKVRCGHGSMNYLLVLVPLAILMGFVGLAAFLWSLRSGQYEDLDGAAERILLDDEDKP